MEQVNDVMSDLKWSEMGEVEEILGHSMDEWENLASKAKLIFALQYVMAKRNKPELTVQEAEQMSIAQLTAISTPTTSPKAK